MKKFILVTAVTMLTVTSAWANQVPEKNGECASMNCMSMSKSTSMNEHEQAIIAHETMNNANSPAHQSIIDMHRKMLQQGQ